jgi:hypothetical protein
MFKEFRRECKNRMAVLGRNFSSVTDNMGDHLERGPGNHSWIEISKISLRVVKHE